MRAAAREWLAENRVGRPNFDRMRQADDDHAIERVGTQLRAMMPWSEEAKNGLEQARTGENGKEASADGQARPLPPVHAKAT